MDNINLLSISPNEIELKYTDTHFPLTFEYIGPNKSHGDLYYTLDWYEILYNYNIVGLICFNQNRFKDSVHISVFEIFEKNKGIGTKTMNYIFEICKSLKYKYITLQAHNEPAKIFYLRLGFIKKTIDNCPYLIKYL